MNDATRGVATIAAILASQPDKARHAEQIAQRIHHVREISGAILSSTKSIEDPTTLDGLELDIWCVLWVPELDKQTKLTSWLLNTGWRSEVPLGSLADEISANVRERLSVPPDLISVATARSWCRLQGEALIETCDACWRATSIESLIANLIAMDGLLLTLLSAITRMRLGVFGANARS